MRRRRGTDRHVVGLAKMSFGKHEHEARLAYFRIADDNVLEEVRLLRRRGGHLGLPAGLLSGCRRRLVAPVLGAGARRGCSALLAQPRRTASALEFMK